MKAIHELSRDLIDSLVASLADGDTSLMRWIGPGIVDRAAEESFDQCPCGHSHEPNKETARALLVLEGDMDLVTFDSLDDLFRDLGLLS